VFEEENKYGPPEKRKYVMINVTKIIRWFKKKRAKNAGKKHGFIESGDPLYRGYYSRHDNHGKRGESKE